MSPVSETKILEAQEQYRLLVEQSTDAIMVADDDWNIRFANRAACQMFGYTHEEIIQRNAEDTVVLEDRHLVAGRKQAIRAGQAACYERAVLRRWSRFLAEVIVRRLDQGGSQAIFSDITERKRAEEKCGCKVRRSRRPPMPFWSRTRRRHSMGQSGVHLADGLFRGSGIGKPRRSSPASMTRTSMQTVGDRPAGGNGAAKSSTVARTAPTTWKR